MALIRDLPFELVAEVFKQGLHMVVGFPDDTVFLLLITSVCSAWRNIALSVPELWASIQSKWLFKKSVWRINVAKERLDTYIARSKNASLDVSLSFTGSRNASTERYIKDTIFSHLYRCRSLNLHLFELAQVEAIFPLRGPMERLRHFGFTFSLREYDIPTVSENTRFVEDSGVLELRSLNIEAGGYEPSFRRALASMSLSSLRSLNFAVHYTSWTDVLSYIAESQNLEELQLRGFVSSHNKETRSLSLSSLKKLTVTPAFLYQCRERISMPNLGELTVTASQISEPFDDTTRCLSEVLHTVRFYGADMDALLLRAVLIPHTMIRTIVLDQRSTYNILFAMLLGIAGGRTGWASYVPAETSLLLFLETIEIRSALWGLETSALAPAMWHLLNLRPSLCIKFDPSHWKMSHHFAAFQALEAEYGQRFMLL